ncbi:MAG: hypothetical protein NVS4B2_30280 [Chloroflexota bacterium]
MWATGTVTVAATRDVLTLRACVTRAREPARTACVRRSAADLETTVVIAPAQPAV